MKRRGAIFLAMLVLLLATVTGLLWPRHDAGPPPSAAAQALPASERI
ncbi:hypothetical protein GM672_13525, partial [Massilia buxea]|nr:hypothetical protein [Pseudoduganella buxea]